MNAEEKLYRSKDPKTIFPLLFSCVMIYGGIYVLPEEPITGWFNILMFGLLSLVFMVQLIPGSNALKLTEEGFETTHLFQKRVIKWTDVKSFEIVNMVFKKGIKFDLNNQHKKYTTRKLLAKQYSRNHGVLPFIYGPQTSELLNLLNDWKNKYGSQGE